ncbi:MAG: Rad52/Rad22 family DNA repair protein [Blastocatellia bacterium]
MMSYQEMAETAVARPKANDESGKAAQRDKRALSLAVMGLVSREGSRYYVKSAAMRGREESYEVWRDENGRVRCSCAEFERQSPDDAAFRCEHILAVKYSLATDAANAENAAPTVQSTSQVAAQEKPEVSDDRDEGEEEMQNYQIETAQNQLEMAEMVEIAESESRRPAPPPAFTSLLHTLRRPIDPRLIKTREGWTDRQGITHWVEYIEWHTVADILDRVAPNWSHAVRNLTQIGDLVAVTAAITIDGVTREGVGTGAAESETGIKKAEHDALKRAAVKFGVARDLYQRESEVIEEDGIAPAIQRDPRPKTLNDMVTPKQLWMIRSLGREAGCDVEQECQSMLQCDLEEISKRAASSFIDYLKRKQQENPPEELRRAS